MKNILSQLVFHRNQQVGILLLLTLNVVALMVDYKYDFKSTTTFDISSEEIIAQQQLLDSLRSARMVERAPKLFPFNPNFITDYKGYTLGMSLEEIDRLHAFRKKDQWINSEKQFQKVTGVSDSILAIIGPAFKFPDWVTNPKPKKAWKKPNTKKKVGVKGDLNQATALELQEVFGIGPTLSARIVSYRKLVGGFSNDLQLNEVWGLTQERVANILTEFTVRDPVTITKMKLNEVSASDIATIPGISFNMAKEIWEFRILREEIASFSELEKIEGLTPRKLQLIQLYLSLE